METWNFEAVTLPDGRTTSESRLTTLPLKVKLADENERLAFTLSYGPVRRHTWKTVADEEQSSDKLLKPKTIGNRKGDCA